MQKNIRQLLATTLLLGGSFSGVQTALAQSTPAGTTISNTANATYSDGSTPTVYNATSNTVIVKVAEVPGINVSAGTPDKPAPNRGDTVKVNFIITNVGNDPTQFHIPDTAKLSGPDASYFSTPQLKIVSFNGTPVNIPVEGTKDTGSYVTNSLPNNGSIPVGGTVIVEVSFQVKANAPSGASTTVALGNTEVGTTVSANAQNVPRTANPDDVYTVDNPDSVPGETPGVITQQNEAMDTSTAVTVGAKPQAFAAILKAVSSYNPGSASTFADDVLTYSLALRVDNPASPPAGLAAADLQPTSITLNGTASDQILISDAIPAKMALSSAIPIAPTGWTPVYSGSNTAIQAHKADWRTDRTQVATITRVGFIRSTAVAKGSPTISGFSFSVNPITNDPTPANNFTGGQVANIAQVFGQSQPGTVAPNTGTQLVYDESGDQTANNGLDGANPDPTGGTPTSNGGISTGGADPVADGVDPGKGTDPTVTTGPTSTNIGTDGSGNGTKLVGGEDTVYTIAATPLNGPKGQPGATNTPNNYNDDFTNQSIALTAGLDPATSLVDAQTPATLFTNTVQNTSGSPQTLLLLPTPPATAGDLPIGTLVKIAAGATDATYRYDGTKFVFVTGTGTTATTPVSLVNIPANDGAPGGADEVNYTVSIDLPDSTVAAPIKPSQAFPVSISAFVNVDNTGSPTNNPSNITIDRLYTGYVNLLKDARILDGTGSTEIVGFTTDQTALSAAAKPGRIIEYRIRYNNLSTAAPASSNSVDLPAKNLVITEDGAAGSNNWFTSTKDPVSGTIPGSALDPTGVISGTSSGGDIQVYIDTIAKLNPQASGTFIFRRLIK